MEPKRAAKDGCCSLSSERELRDKKRAGNEERIEGAEKLE